MHHAAPKKTGLFRDKFNILQLINMTYRRSIFADFFPCSLYSKFFFFFWLYNVEKIKAIIRDIDKPNMRGEGGYRWFSL